MTKDQHHPYRFAVQAFSAPTGAAWRALAREVEALGYSTLHLADHYIGPGPKLDPTNHPVQDLAAVPAMVSAADATTTLRVGCRVFCTGYHNAVVLAKELATIDLLSDGRLEAGLGAGWLANEYEAMGVPMPAAGERIRMLEETLDVVEASFAGGPVSVDGRHVHATGFEARPPAVQQPRPPIMIGGGAPRVLRLAGRRADIVSLNFDNSSGVIGFDGLMSSTAERTQAKLAWISEGASTRTDGKRLEDLEIEIGSYFTVVDPTGQAVERTAAGFGMTVEQFRAYPHALAGSVAEIVDEIRRRREELGITYYTVNANAMQDFAPVVAALAGTN
jgi:probable F420-dependent oxidoreductase